MPLIVNAVTGLPRFPVRNADWSPCGSRFGAFSRSWAGAGSGAAVGASCSVVAAFSVASWCAACNNRSAWSTGSAVGRRVTVASKVVDVDMDEYLRTESGRCTLRWGADWAGLFEYQTCAGAVRYPRPGGHFLGGHGQSVARPSGGTPNSGTEVGAGCRLHFSPIVIPSGSRV